MSKLLPIIILDMIRKIKASHVIFNINTKIFKIKMSDSKEFNKAISTIGTSVRKSINSLEFNQESMDLAQKLLVFIVKKTKETIE